METKNKRDSLERIRKRLRFNNSSYVEPECLSGGLALWWTDEVTVDVRFKSKNLFRCIVNLPLFSSPFLVTFVYAPPVWNHRLAFWNYLRNVASENRYPWLCVGDLNDCVAQVEKQGGNPCSRSRMEHFHSMVSDCDATRVGSDHCPLVVFFEVKLKKVPFQFKFESKWSTHPECSQVVSRVWNENQGGSALYGLVQKLKKCKGELLKWSRLVFGKDKLKLKLLQEKLKAIQATPFSADSFKEERDIIEEMEMLLLREEMALHQRSRINWLLYGD
ncbi:hypothetical protein RHGRI_009405 [Rhododendron griersonianum]|uniref:Endonuclease/exonuclease/phosphatase domain-containing protein n=1 Tax=Rhododendron griersonianum TaxID=479676 RepID=A0AAV6KFC1_9ERIC|nr:hypothetical protein RHGRI_009405 [Rhododendron griersonianum]